MSRFLVAVLGALLVVSVGCQDKDKDPSSDKGAMKAGDVCPHCDGVQKANAEGKCPICYPSKPSAGASAAPAGADVCTNCPGTQVATAENKCSKCGADLSKKQ